MKLLLSFIFSDFFIIYPNDNSVVSENDLIINFFNVYYFFELNFNVIENSYIYLFV